MLTALEAARKTRLRPAVPQTQQRTGATALEPLLTRWTGLFNEPLQRGTDFNPRQVTAGGDAGGDAHERNLKVLKCQAELRRTWFDRPGAHFVEVNLAVKVLLDLSDHRSASTIRVPSEHADARL